MPNPLLTMSRQRDIMSSPVVTVGEETDVDEITRLLTTHRIKRVPVLRERRIVGIVSRADLLRALAAEPPPPPAPGLFASAIAGLEERFLDWKPPEPAAAALPAQRPASNRLAVADFQGLVTDFERKEAEHREEARRVAAIEHKHRSGGADRPAYLGGRLARPLASGAQSRGVWPAGIHAPAVPEPTLRRWRPSHQ
jgi:CBS domain-containing protein